MYVRNANENRCHHHPARGLVLICVLATFAALFASSASASATLNPEITDSRAIPEANNELTLAQKVQAAYWRGRTCSTPACKAARPSGLTDVASFGLAALGGVWFSRRRSS
ncbi:MAG: hypothetical protein QMC73_10015 [Myxococcota bacterium]|jgi:hypothetical protein